MSPEDLVYAIQEELGRIQWSPFLAPEELARNLGYKVREIMKKLANTALPAGFTPPKEIFVDWDQRSPQPVFRVTMRW